MLRFINNIYASFYFPLFECQNFVKILWGEWDYFHYFRKILPEKMEPVSNLSSKTDPADGHLRTSQMFPPEIETLKINHYTLSCKKKSL